MLTQSEITNWLKENQHLLDAPEGYIGGEINTFDRSKDWDKVLTRMIMVNVYDYRTQSGSMSVSLLYHLINEYHGKDIILDRGCFPSTRREMELFEEAGCPIFGLDSKRPITDFDIVGFSVCFGMGYFNMVKMLQMSNIPLFSKDRDDSHPLIIMGGMAIYNPEPAADFVDVVYIGDGETNMSRFLKLWGERKKQGVAKMDILEEATKTIEGIYVPALYEVKFGEDLREKERIALRPGIPMRIKKTSLNNLSDVPIFAKQIVHWDGNGMGIGEVLASRGCYWGKCTFCSEGYTQLPYREETENRIVEGLKLSMKECGTTDVLPGGYGIGDYSSKKKLLKRLVEEVSDKVTLLSLRVDQMADDPNWALMTGNVGNETVSIGVEGISERLRRVVNKGVTEDQILRATRYLIQAGVKKIKYFMIANLPTENDADLMEFAETVKKVAAIRDELDYQGEIKWSFTPMTYSEFTPLQFCAINLDKRTLNTAFDNIKEYELAFRLGSSARVDEIYCSTIIHMSDRRFSSVMAKMVLNDGMMHFGMTRKGSKDKVEAYLQEMGLSYAHYFAQKDFAYKFPWDFVDVGVTKKYLWEQYTLAMKEIPVPGCFQKCTACSACKPIDFKLKKEWKTDEAVELDKIVKLRQRGTVGKLRVKVYFDEVHRFVDKRANKFMLRRAAYKAGLPLDKYTIAQTSDKIDVDNWVYGTDYVDFKLIEKTTNAEQWLMKLSEHLVGAVGLSAYMLPALEGTLLRSFNDLCLYEMPLSKQGVGEATDQAKWFMEQSFVPVEELAAIRETKSMKQKNAFLKQYKTAVRIKKMTFVGMERVITDLRPMVDGVWAIERDGQVYMRALIRGEVLPYDLYLSMFGGRWREAVGNAARRLDFFKPVSEDQDDIFAERCDCGKKVEENIVGETISGDKCLQCSDLAGVPYGSFDNKVGKSGAVVYSGKVIGKEAVLA